MTAQWVLTAEFREIREINLPIDRLFISSTTVYKIYKRWETYFFLQITGWSPTRRRHRKPFNVFGSENLLRTSCRALEK